MACHAIIMQQDMVIAHYKLSHNNLLMVGSISFICPPHQGSTLGLMVFLEIFMIIILYEVEVHVVVDMVYV